MSYKYVVKKHDDRRAPVEFRDEAELFARKHGGHGDVVWMPAPVNCWQVRLSLPLNDPRLRDPDEGTHFESVELHEFVDPRREPTHPHLDMLRRHHRTNAVMPGYIRIELDELGVSGMREILEKGSLLSGRGEFNDSMAATKAVMEGNRKTKAHNKHQQREHAIERIKHNRRAVLGIPQIVAGIDLTGD